MNISVPTNDDAVSLNTLNLLLGLLEAQHPAIIVEAGTFKGSFAVAVACHHPTAHVYTADVVDHNWTQTVERNPNCDATRIIFVQDDFGAIATRYSELVGHVDVAFIDSGWPMLVKEPRMRIRHYRLAQQWCKPGGYVYVDDMLGEWEGREEIAAESVLLPTDRGLSVWRKPT